MVSKCRLANGDPSDVASVPRLPLVDAFVDRLRAANFAFDPSTHMIVSQHMLATNLTLFRALFDLGVSPKQTYVIGKGYSTSLRCVEALRSMGARVTDDAPPPHPGQYASQRTKELEQFWASIDGDRILASRNPVILDDVGGRLLARAARCIDTYRLVGVEQTSSGIRRLEDLGVAIPVVNLAEAGAKTAHESPLVAEGILERLDALSPGSWPNVDVGVIGLGSIGLSIVSALKARGINVACYDIKKGRNSDASSRRAIGDIFSTSDVIFGCTGRPLFEEWPAPSHRPGLTLVSCSSEDIEFAAILRRGAKPISTAWPAQDCVVRHPAGDITILSGGYPLNFDCSGISLPEQAIQLTTTLTLAGIVTAASMLSGTDEAIEPGLYRIPVELQATIIDLYETIGGRWAAPVPTLRRLAASTIGRNPQLGKLLGFAKRHLVRS